MKLRSKKQTPQLQPNENFRNIRKSPQLNRQDENHQVREPSPKAPNETLRLSPKVPVQPTNPDQNENDKAESLIKELFDNLGSKVSYTRALDAFIRRNDVYSKFKPTRRKFSRRRTVVHGPFNSYQIDLSDFRSIRHSNRNIGWLLFIIDGFSRFGYCIPLRHKNAKETHDALEKWFLSLNHLPKFIYSDEGKEFTNSSVQQLFKTRGVVHYVLKGVHKAAIVERFQRTIKTNLEMYFYKHKTKNWISVIEKIVSNYNKRYHRSIKMAPSDITYSNFETVYKELYPKKSNKRLCRLAVGDLVRISLKKKEFSKGYHQTFSNETYQILKAIDYHGVCWYTVQDIKGGPEIQKYYHELSLVAKNDLNSTRSKRLQRS